MAFGTIPRGAKAPDQTPCQLAPGARAGGQLPARPLCPAYWDLTAPHLEAAAEDDHRVGASHCAGLSGICDDQLDSTLALADVVLGQLHLHSGD